MVDCSRLAKHRVDDKIVLHLVTVNEKFIFQFLAHAEEAQLRRIRIMFSTLFRADKRYVSILDLLYRAEVGAPDLLCAQLKVPYLNSDLFLFRSLLGLHCSQSIVNIVIVR